MSLLFVGGSQRSGTTILQRFLCADSDAAPRLAEASYLRMLVSTYQQAVQDFAHDTSSYFADREQFRNFHASLVNIFLNRTLNAHYPAKHLVLKEPHLTPLFPALYELVPNARFVLIFRDPRDTIASMLQVGDRMKQQGQQHFFQQRDMKQLSNYVKAFYSPVLNVKDKTFQESVGAVTYENLINSSDAVLDELRRFTGMELQFDRSQLGSGDRPGEESLPRYQPWITPLYDKGLSDQSIGNYKNILDTEEIAVIEQEMADYMKKFGYA